MKHLVTGGSGFLGSLIAKRLHAQGETVRILDIWDDPQRPEGTEFINCDIRDRAGVLAAMQGVDVVHHNVALVPLTKSGEKFWDVNVNGSRIAAECAVEARVSYFVHMSSSAIFGLPKKCPIDNNTPTEPIEIYGRGKLAGEQTVREICDRAGLPLVVIRPRTILGEGRLGIFQILFEWIEESRGVYVIGDGNIQFQFIHAHDLMDAYMLVINHGRQGAYNVGTDRFGTLRGDMEKLFRHAGSRSTVRSLPVGPTIGTLGLLDKLGLCPLAPWHYLTYHKDFHFDITPLLELGWKPKYSNEEMFCESYDWFQANRNRAPSAAGGSPHRKPVREKILWLLKKLS
jgi:nucleoside-diphosphate-sugar epimerase